MRPSIRTFILIAILGCAAPLSAQLRPSTITSVTPPGLMRGGSATFTIEGANLGRASAILFGHPGLRGEISNIIELPYQPVARPRGFTGAPIEDVFALHRLLVKVQVDQNTPTGRYNFRIKTPLGTTNTGSLYVGSLTEISEAEPNNTSAEAHKIFFPSTLLGTITRSGDEDTFEFDVDEGKTLVFELQAAMLGSGLDSQLTLLDASESVLSANNDYNGRLDSFVSYTFPKTGSYRLRIGDATGGGSARHFYRLNIGALPYITRAFPLGVRKGTPTEIHLDGVNLTGVEKIRVEAPGSAGTSETFPIQPAVRGRESLNRVALAIGENPEINEAEANNTPDSAQSVTLPVCINGRIDGSSGGPDQDVFRFKAKKGERISLTVLAQRLGSPLDSILEIVDSQGRTIPRTLARPVWQTVVTLNDPDSVRRGIRIDSWSALGIRDYVMIGNELLQVEELPKNPDDDIKFRSFRGARMAFEGTTPETHSLGTPVYKVELHKPDTKFPSNGMPLFPIPYVNDDGGQGQGKDSHLLFVAPGDGDYFVRIRDIRGLGGRDFAYRLILTEPRPDFALTVDPKNPNIPLGDSVPVTVTATRLDGFEGPIDIQLLDLPAGVTAAPGRILPGSSSTTLTVRAAADAMAPAKPAPFRVVGKAMINGSAIERLGDNSMPLDDSVAFISLTETPEVLVTSAEPRELVLEPGTQGSVTVTIARQKNFAGRVPVDVRNLPLGVIIPDVGLNGILITEDENSRTFHIEVDPKTEPLEQTLYLVARIENNSPNPSEHASQAIRLKVVPKKPQVSQTNN